MTSSSKCRAYISLKVADRFDWINILVTDFKRWPV